MKQIHLLSRLESWITPAWDHWLSGIVIWIVPIGFMVWFFFDTPPPGMASMVCGGCLAVMMLRNMTASQRILCTLLAMTFVGTEIRSIRIDRAKQDEAHRTELNELGKHFDETQKRIDAVLGTSTNVLNNVTGGSSLPALLPHFVLYKMKSVDRLLPPNSLGFSIDFRIENIGEYTLNGVMYESFYHAWGGGGGKFTDRIGPIVLAPHSNTKALDLKVDTDADGVAKVQTRLYAQNGIYMEDFSIKKKSNDANKCIYKYTISRDKYYFPSASNHELLIFESSWIEMVCLLDESPSDQGND